MEWSEYLKSWIYQYSDRLAQVAYTYLRDWNKAEDVTQETFIKAYEFIHQLENPDNPYPWLDRIVINH